MKKILILLLAVLCLTTTVFAAGESYIRDDCDLLSGQQAQELELLAKGCSEALNCGIYVRVVEDYRDFGSYNIEVVSKTIYDNEGLGLGTDRNGILLVLSMNDRDYTIYSGGPLGEKILNDYAAADLSTYFLDDFRVNDWYAGLKDYIVRANRILTDGQEGKILTVNSDPGFVRVGTIAVLVISVLAGGITVLVLTLQLKSVKAKNEANDYVTPRGVNISHRSDTFTHTTYSRRKIESSSGGGGSHHVSTSRGGGRTGKF